MSWLPPHNTALSLYSENPPFTKEALTSLSSLPEEVSVENLLLTITRGTVSKHFFLVESKSAPCVLFGSTEFRRRIDNHNRCNEREIGRLKDWLHKKYFRTIHPKDSKQIFVFAHIYAIAVCECWPFEKLAQNDYGMPHVKKLFV